MTSLRSKQLIERARREVQEETDKKDVQRLKEKLRLRAKAAKILKNLDREIEDLELKLNTDAADVSS